MEFDCLHRNIWCNREFCFLYEAFYIFYDVYSCQELSYVFLVMLGDIDGITKFDNQSPLLGSCSSAIEESL